MLNFKVKFPSAPYRNICKRTEFYACYISCSDFMTTEIQHSNCEFVNILMIMREPVRMYLVNIKGVQY